MGKLFFKKILLSIFFLLLLNNVLLASEEDLIKLSQSFYSKGEYYSAISELKRYQFIYPNGKFFPKSMLLLGKSYFKGNNYGNAINTLSACYIDFSKKSEGEEALFLMGAMRLYQGSPLFAYRTFMEYRQLYGKGRFFEKTDLYLCYTSVFLSNLVEAKDKIDNFKKEYPGGEYLHKANELESIIMDEINRPRKKLWVSVLGSIFMPGFGHFYTGKYKEGIFTLFTNALFALLIYNGYRNNDLFQMIFFSVIEVTFYQYSIMSAIRNVYEYNKQDNFFKRIKLSLSTTF